MKRLRCNAILICGHPFKDLPFHIVTAIENKQEEIRSGAKFLQNYNSVIVNLEEVGEKILSFFSAAIHT